MCFLNEQRFDLRMHFRMFLIIFSYGLGRGCDAQHCMYTLDLEAEYDNLNLNGSTDDEPPSLIHHQFKSPAAGLLQQAVPGNHRKRYVK